MEFVNPLNVLYQTNEYYAVVTGVSMVSLMENNRDLDAINFYVLDDEISESSREKMRQACAEYGRSVTFLDTKHILQKLKDMNVVPFRETYTTYFKLIALNEIDAPGGRILQLDGDTIINASLRPLLEMDISEYVCAAVYECTQNEYKEMIGIPADQLYYNCGVLWVNLENWRGERCTERIIEHLTTVRNRYWSVDQDIINVLFRDRIKVLDITYNYNSGFYTYGVDESFRIYGLDRPTYYTREYVKERYAHPTINHCMGAATGRPWELDSIHPQNGLFDHYLRRSPWSDYVKKGKQRSPLFRAQRMLYQVMPRPLYVPLHTAVLKRYLKKMNEAAVKESPSGMFGTGE